MKEILASRVKRVLDELPDDLSQVPPVRLERMLERINSHVGRAGKDAILSEFSGAERGAIIAKLNSAIGASNARLGKGRVNPLQ